MNEITKVDKGIYQCDNCGAFADLPQKIKHYVNCRKGESKKWQKFYSQQEEKDLCQR